MNKYTTPQQKSFQRIGYAKTMMILDFIKTASSNSVSCLSVYLPANHPALGRGVKQIRVLKDVIAEGYDTLGNRIILTTGGIVMQILSGEK